MRPRDTTQLSVSRRQWRTPHHVLGMADVADRLGRILASAQKLKGHINGKAKALEGKSVLLVLEKNSTRTRVSLEIGVRKLGGHVVVLDAATSQMGRGESIEDTAQVLSRYADAIVYRANKHTDIEQMARHARVPVVNALSELEHPLQVLADWMTLVEKWGALRGRTFAYVGDGNNMCNSYLLGAAIAGMHVRIATPAGFEPHPAVVEQAEVWARQNGTTVWLGTDPHDAVVGADAVATDTWISMGSETEADERRSAFVGFTVDDAMMDAAGPGALFMHCLPGHWGEEATHAVAHGPRSVAYDQAENRMWVQMALLVDLLPK